MNKKIKLLFGVLLCFVIFMSCSSNNEELENDDNVDLAKISDTSTRTEDEQIKEPIDNDEKYEPIEKQTTESITEPNDKSSKISINEPAIEIKEEPIKKPTDEPKVEVSKQDETPKQPIKPLSPDEIIEDTLSVTMSLDCSTVLDNMDLIDPFKVSLIPENGMILSTTNFEIAKGESVFDVLLRETKNNKIHMEYVDTPLYDSAYIEGINNLYEFDVGELSGWMYRVNGEFPTYGSSKYKLEDGDIIEWIYTCDLGSDIGNNTNN